MLVNHVRRYGLGPLLFSMLFSLASVQAAPLLEPDQRADHCHAFEGTWKNGACKDRYEYQQRPIGRDFQQFCEARGGLYKITKGRKGYRRSCTGADSIQGMDHYPVAAFDNSNINLDIERACLNYDFSQKDCEVADSKEVKEWFDYTNAPAIGSTAYNIVIESVLDGFANLKTNKQGEMYRRNINAKLYNKMVKEKLNTCQKACLTKCATATIMDYNHKIGNGPHPYSTEYFYSHRSGVCTEFSRLNKDIADLTGTEVLMRGTLKGMHSYNYYKINGRWYYGEPQNNSCKFFHSKSTLKTYKKQITGYTGAWTKVLPRPTPYRRRRASN
jgi:hypothetical protein